MSEDKTNKNTFANLLNKKNQTLQNKNKSFTKQSKGFSSPNLVKRSGRGR